MGAGISTSRRVHCAKLYDPLYNFSWPLLYSPDIQGLWLLEGCRRKTQDSFFTLEKEGM